MHGRPITQPVGETHASHPNRWRILGVLIVALLVTSIDHTIINVAMPRLVGDLGASSAQLQWIVASYTIVFAGLLLTAGSIGDRFGRRHALLAGLATFLAGSVVAATAGSTAALIAGRCVMGVGGALIMPTTLSILVNVFGDPRERAKAIAGWTAASGAGIALGPIVGGALMRSFSWSSVFWINVPLLVVAFVAAVHLVPDSRDPHATRLDPVGAGLSIAAISTLVYAIVQAPERGWTSSPSLVNFAVGSAVAILFVGWELRRTDPMLDMSLFRNRSFSAGSVALALLFFAMAGAVFLQAQYLQFVLEYTPLAAGFALVPAAIGMLLGTGAGAHLAQMHGGRIAVTAGTLVAGAGVAVQAAFVDGGSYLPTGVGLLLFGLGAGVAMPAATEMIMSTLPPARAGVGSAVNDTVREFGGALGVAVIGSVAATSYATSMRGELDRFPNLTSTDRHMLTDNVGAAIETSQHLGAQADRIAEVARTAFVDSMHSSLWVAAGLAACAAVVTFTQLPRQAAHGAHGAHGAHAGHGSHGGHHPHTAALVLARARHRVVVVDDQTYRNATVGEFHGFPTRDATAPSQFRTDALAELQRYDVAVISSAVTGAASTERCVSMALSDGRTVEGGALVLATGVHDELPPVAGLAERWGRSVFNCPFCDGWEHRDRPVVVIDAAPGAEQLAGLVRSWTPQVTLVAVADVRELVGDGTSLDHVALREGRTIPAAAAFVKVPVVPRSTIATALGCAVDADGYVVTTEAGATSHPRVWAAGDVRRAPPAPHQVVLAATDGSAAAIAVHKAFVAGAL